VWRGVLTQSAGKDFFPFPKCPFGFGSNIQNAAVFAVCGQRQVFQMAFL